MSEDSWVGLADAVKGIRAELAEAMDAGKGERLKFEVGPVELEFKVELRRDAEARTGVKIWVVEAGGSGAVSHTSGHTLKVTLNPVDSTTDRSPLVSDTLDALPPRPGPR
ncbi:trypco2 family protein [Rhizohabitans arisaemae]|uniref:trypco2 family protein n=1 Tax=Rhizohabitans arisaemae TaxID=2720610 RepID=UPI0024B24D6C|nr:trypco2 family protein [Rhizohabitans arisaemae]